MSEDKPGSLKKKKEMMMMMMMKKKKKKKSNSYRGPHEKTQAGLKM